MIRFLQNLSMQSRIGIYIFGTGKIAVDLTTTMVISTMGILTVGSIMSYLFYLY